jgi:predicted lysophospholipase L1 biosynthesis ABC-type transport system permease subunit
MEVQAQNFNQQKNMTGTGYLETRKSKNRALQQVTLAIQAVVLCRKAATITILMKTLDLSKEKRRKSIWWTRPLKTMISTLY